MSTANHSHGSKPGHALAAVEQSCALIEKTLGNSSAFRKVDTGLYVVKQGSSYVMISVMGSGPSQERALVRVTAQVVSGVRPEPSLFRQLLILNGTLRFGAFAYVPDGEIVLFNHSLLGGATLDASEILAAVHDVALVADGYDDRIVARYGGRRMQDVVEESAMAHLLSPDREQDVLLEEEPERDTEPVTATAGASARPASGSGSPRRPASGAKAAARPASGSKAERPGAKSGKKGSSS